MQRIRLDQDTVEFHHAQKLLESGPLAGFMGVIALLRQCNTERPGVYRDLGNKAMLAVLGLDSRAPQRFAVADQLVQTVGPAWDLAGHPGLEHLPELLQVGLIEQVEEGGIGGPALEIQVQRLVQGLPVPLGECLQITGATAVTEDAEHRHQQQEPLGITHAAAVAAVGNGFEETDQIDRYVLIDSGRVGFWHWTR